MNQILYVRLIYEDMPSNSSSKYKHILIRIIYYTSMNTFSHNIIKRNIRSLSGITIHINICTNISTTFVRCLFIHIIILVATQSHANNM